MSTENSKFTFHLKPYREIDLPCIELDGDVIYSITDLNEFYKYLGYSERIALSGVLPDEFVWKTYFKDSVENCASCYQLHIIDFLLRYSKTFAKKYGSQCQKLITPHTALKAQCSATACKARKFVNPSPR
jgi:hypothetical protein